MNGFLLGYLIIDSDVLLKGWTHLSNPYIYSSPLGKITLFYASRDTEGRSHVWGVDLVEQKGYLKAVGKPNHYFSPGRKGDFDADGVVPSTIVTNRGETFLYYVGWQRLPNGLYETALGLAQANPEDMEFVRLSHAPVLGKSEWDPISVGAADVSWDKEASVWQAIYETNLEWTSNNPKTGYRFGFRRAISSDGVKWEPEEALMLIPEKNETFTSPRFIAAEDTKCYLLFAMKKRGMHYSMKMLATENQGQHWKGLGFGLKVSSGQKWDDQEQTYPSNMFKGSDGQIFTAYNGNSYGKTGIGVFTLDPGLLRSYPEP